MDIIKKHTHTYGKVEMNWDKILTRTKFASDTHRLSEIANELSKVCKAKRYFAKMFHNFNLFSLGREKRQKPPIQGPVLDCEWMGVCGIFRNLGPNSVNMDPSLAHDDRISDQRAGRKWVRGTIWSVQFQFQWGCSDHQAMESMGSRHYYENCDLNEWTVIGWVELKMLGNLGTGRSIAKSCSSFLTKSKPIFLNPAFEIFTSDGQGKSIPQDGEPEKPYLEAVRTTEDLSALSKIDLSHFIKLFPTRKYFP